MRRLALFRVALWAMIALFGGAALALTFMRGDGPLAIADQPYGTPFRLEDQNGRPVTEALFRGRPSAVFFGYTNCPDVCPTTMSELGAYREALKAKGKDFQIVFVTVDPARDTPDFLKTYVGAISPDIVALTGPQADVAAMLKGWGVYWKKVGEGRDYAMDHTATTFLLDSGGRLFGTLAYDEDETSAKAKLERLAAS
ncbi:electron transporter SCO1/SenC [Aureimonas endophytica]|uniref:Electron transporter SCO1/SenC n=1 Tax=Aureimonas endophytica TaxID=2027858 RepID=A0A916ZFK0_9HYPH|nr:SCO family protein [Aureimonas endophytica]GGD92161.1 electron transporter SCO1/SenC [Aureimonas endophytica]